MPQSAVNASTPWVVKHVINPLMLLTGGLPILEVRGRRSGKTFRTPINVLEMNGARYLTSPRGETGWSRNLRATGEGGVQGERHHEGIPRTDREPRAPRPHR